MIRYLANNEIDPEKWDNCIEEAFNGMVYAKTWWLDMVAPGWEGLVSDDYESVMPLVGNRKYGINYLYQPAFTQQLGVFSKLVLSEHLVNDFIEAIPRKFKFAEINLNTFNKFSGEVIESQSWRTHELELIKRYESLAKSYSTNLRRNIKKAESNKLTLVKSSKPEDIIHLFRENRGKNINHLKEEHYTMLARLIYAGIYKGLVTTYGVFSPTNDLCAGAVFLRSKKKAIFLFSGLNDVGKEMNAMPWLIDKFIYEHSQQHLTLDFEGSNDPNLARFYKSFAAREITYPHLKINRLPWFVSAGLKLIKGIR